MPRLLKGIRQRGRNFFFRVRTGGIDRTIPLGRDPDRAVTRVLEIRRRNARPAFGLSRGTAQNHRDSLDRLSGALDRNVLALRDAVAGPDSVPWPVSDTAFFRNLNTPRDFERHCAASPHRT